MKTSCRNFFTNLIALCGATLLLPQSLNAAEWETVIEGSGAPEGRALLPDPTRGEAVPRRLFVGTYNPGGVLILDQATREVIPAVGIDISSRVQAITFAAESRSLFAAGASSDYRDWQVWKSSDQGATWSLADRLASESPGQLLSDGAAANGATVDATGNVVISGSTVDAAQRTHWIIKMSPDDGQTWRIVSDVPGSVGGQVVSVPGEANQVVAIGVNASLSAVVMQSRGESRAWNSLATFSGAESSSVIAADAAGSIYVAIGGSAGKVCRSVDGGVTWTTILRIADRAAIRSICLAPNGDIHLAGLYEGWFVQSRLSGAWQARTYPFGRGIPVTSRAAACQVDPAGNVYVTGGLRDEAGAYSLGVQRFISTLPEVQIRFLEGGAVLQWLALSANAQLERAAALPAIEWLPVPQTPQTANGAASLSLPVEGAGFFRLRSE